MRVTGYVRSLTRPSRDCKNTGGYECIACSHFEKSATIMKEAGTGIGHLPDYSTVLIAYGSEVSSMKTISYTETHT
jgi:hypothetical protein